MKGDRVDIDIKKFHSMHRPKRFPGAVLITYKKSIGTVVENMYIILNAANKDNEMLDIAD